MSMGNIAHVRKTIMISQRSSCVSHLYFELEVFFKTNGLPCYKHDFVTLILSQILRWYVKFHIYLNSLHFNFAQGKYNIFMQ